MFVRVAHISTIESRNRGALKIIESQNLRRQNLGIRGAKKRGSGTGRDATLLRCQPPGIYSLGSTVLASKAQPNRSHSSLPLLFLPQLRAAQRLALWDGRRLVPCLAQRLEQAAGPHPVGVVPHLHTTPWGSSRGGSHTMCLANE